MMEIINDIGVISLLIILDLDWDEFGWICEVNLLQLSSEENFHKIQIECSFGHKAPYCHFCSIARLEITLGFWRIHWEHRHRKTWTKCLIIIISCGAWPGVSICEFTGEIGKRFTKKTPSPKRFSGFFWEFCQILPDSTGLLSASMDLSTPCRPVPTRAFFAAFVCAELFFQTRPGWAERYQRIFRYCNILQHYMGGS